jgi:hypothetical protein
MMMPPGWEDMRAAHLAQIEWLNDRVKRLEGLIKQVEWKCKDFEGYVICPWGICDYEKDLHSPACPAFTPDGKVK